MSGNNKTKSERIERLLALFHAILEKNDALGAIRMNQDSIDEATPMDVIDVVDLLVKEGLPMDHLKTGINKFLNVLFKSLDSRPEMDPGEGSFLDCCIRNNRILDQKLKDLKPLIKQINKFPGNKVLKKDIRTALGSLSEYHRYYQIKENILFPLLEGYWSNFGCLKVMWSFHDDIRRNLKRLLEMMEGDYFNLQEFNQVTGMVFFDMYAIRFREEKILFPCILETITARALDSILPESLEMGFPYYHPALETVNTRLRSPSNGSDMDLGTGRLTVEEAALIFNHLPVDITFVDENNKVRYFSQPQKRIFPRSKAIIGRDVRNCHPPESLHMVEEIIDSFRSGKKDQARFWIEMKGEFILIEYYAIRDHEGKYKGVLEVSQDATSIRALKGQKRLLDWGD